MADGGRRLPLELLELGRHFLLVRLVLVFLHLDEHRGLDRLLAFREQEREDVGGLLLCRLSGCKFAFSLLCLSLRFLSGLRGTEGR